MRKQHPVTDQLESGSGRGRLAVPSGTGHEHPAHSRAGDSRRTDGDAPNAQWSRTTLRPDGWTRPTGPRPAFSFVFGNPPQGRQPKIVTAVHQAFVGLTQLLGVAAFPDLVGDHHASVALRLQIPCVVESRLGAGRVAIPADAGVGHEFIDAAFEIDAERLPAE